jgi:hypothetical protein
MADLLRARTERLERFAIWSSLHPPMLTPAAAVASIGSLYQLLPPASRQRPVDTAGVARMHAVRRLLS